MKHWINNPQLPQRRCWAYGVWIFLGYAPSVLADRIDIDERYVEWQDSQDEFSRKSFLKRTGKPQHCVIADGQVSCGLTVAF